MLIINESGLYALVFGSKLETARKFKRWVTSEVLPALRKTSSYEMPKKGSQSKAQRPALSSVNMMVKKVMSTLEKAKVEPVYVAAEVKRLYTDLGYEVKAHSLLIKKPCRSSTTAQRLPRSWESILPAATRIIRL